MQFSIDNREVEQYTKKLRALHRSNLPIAVRQTLNDLAFDVKKNTLATEFKKQFVRRNKSFLKSQSGVQKAEGFNINSMQAEVGITPKGSGSEAAEGLTKQEFGGSKQKSLIYMRTARSGNSNKRIVNASRYYNKYQKIRGEHANVKRHSRASNFVASAIMAHRLGKLLIWDSKSGQTVFLIQSVYLGANNAVSVKAIPVADYENKRILNLKAKPFLLPASKMSHFKGEHFFIKNAKKRFEKALK